MPTDFNGDGRDDILWFNGNGTVSNWLANPNGSFTVNDANALNHVSDWVIVGTGDFNGDGRDDILWRNFVTGQLSDWLGTSTGGYIINDAAALTSPGSIPLEWDLLPQFIGDFTGDGRDDLLWIDVAGQRATIWVGTSTGGFAGTPLDDVAFPVYDSPLPSFIGVGDFNGDGRDDILQWSTGLFVPEVRMSNGDGSFSSFVDFANEATADWLVVGTGDFNGDGYDDILWRHTNGALSDWLSDGDGSFTVNDAAAFHNVPTDWVVVGVGDYNGDGRDDILWRNYVTGQLSDWLGTANGGFIINDPVALTQVTTDWFVFPIQPGADT